MYVCVGAFVCMFVVCEMLLSFYMQRCVSLCSEVHKYILETMSMFPGASVHQGLKCVSKISVCLCFLSVCGCVSLSAVNATVLWFRSCCHLVLAV